jgi:hypothetical protein
MHSLGHQTDLRPHPSHAQLRWISSAGPDGDTALQGDPCHERSGCAASTRTKGGTLGGTRRRACIATRKKSRPASAGTLQSPQARPLTYVSLRGARSDAADIATLRLSALAGGALLRGPHRDLGQQPVLRTSPLSHLCMCCMQARPPSKPGPARRFRRKNSSALARGVRSSVTVLVSPTVHDADRPPVRNGPQPRRTRIPTIGIVELEGSGPVQCGGGLAESVEPSGLGQA